MTPRRTPSKDKSTREPRANRRIAEASTNRTEGRRTLRPTTDDLSTTTPAAETGPTNQPVTVNELEDMLQVAAYIVLHYGGTYAPTMYRLIRELEIAKRDDPRKVAKELLDSYFAKKDGAQK